MARHIDRDYIDHLQVEAIGPDNRARLAAASLIQFAAHILERHPEQREVFKALYGPVSYSAITKEAL